MLKRLFTLIFSAFSVASCTRDFPPSRGVARITIDDEHLQLQRADGRVALMYTVSPSSALELDCSSYKLVVPEALRGKEANSIQLIVEKEQYSATLKREESVHILSQNTLTPNGGSVPFQGLRSGQEGVVAVGYMENGKFSVYWVGMFKVQ